ncbi:MAG: DUF3619 family protein [Burkholderiaceae bacterium]|nr:DUF3619 family protein [Burkholderiaceae bacterium]
MNNVQELNFGYKVRHALNDQLDNLPSSTTERLASARLAAMKRKKKDAPLTVLVQHKVLAGNTGGTFGDEHTSWYARIGFVLPVVILVLGLIGIVQYEKQQRINETADIDTAMLTDDLPVAAYADHGFNAYLEKRAE